MRPYSIAATQITDKIYVSSFIIPREGYFGNYNIKETWVFSEDPKQDDIQVGHSSPYKTDTEILKIHCYIVENLWKKYPYDRAEIVEVSDDK